MPIQSTVSPAETVRNHPDTEIVAKMDPAVKADWVKALRSDEFRQGHGKLHDADTDSYCCLGVLCKVVGAVFTEAEINVEGYDGSYPSEIEHAPVLDGRSLVSDDSEELSAAFCKQIGIPNQADLIALNDGDGKPGEEKFKAPQPFSVIADYIEQNL